MQQHGPWQIVKSGDVYRDAWLHVRKDDVIRPDGAPGTHCVVFMKPGVSVLALDDENRVYLTDEFHYGVGRRTLEVVSGGREPDEAPLTAAQRELEEELGIVAEEWIELGSFDPFTTMLCAPAELFLARRLRFGASRPEGTEEIRCVPIDLDEAIAMAMDGRITHGPSCAVILKSARLLGK